MGMGSGGTGWKIGRGKWYGGRIWWLKGRDRGRRGREEVDGREMVGGWTE